MLFRFFCTCVLALVLFACGNDSKGFERLQAEMPSAVTQNGYLSMTDDIDMEAPRTASSPPSASNKQTPAAQQKIIYTAEARARVRHLDSALIQLTRQITRSGGFVSSQHIDNSTHRKTANLVLRLPSDQLNTALALLPDLTEEVDFQNLDSRNVTAEWLDLESRLNTKREVRDRYVEILRNRAQKVEDILNAEEKIRVITEEIEAKEGRLRYLRDQVDMSTFELTLYETIEVRETGQESTYGFGSRVVDSLSFGWAMVEEILFVLLASWPLILFGVIGILLFRRWRK